MADLSGLDALIQKQFSARPKRKKPSYDNSKRDIFWMSETESIIRLVPYIHDDNTLDFSPFKLFHIHYGRNANNKNAPLEKMRVSPLTWEQEDVLVEYADKIFDTDFELSKSLQPSPNYHVPILLYDANGENPQVCFWSMNPTVFEMLVNYYKNPEYGSLHDEDGGCRLTVFKNKSNGKWKFNVQPSRKEYPLTDDEKELIKTMKRFEEAYSLPKEGELEEALIRFVKKHFGDADDGEIEYSAATTSIPSVKPPQDTPPKVTPPPTKTTEKDIENSIDDLDALLGD